LDLFGFLVRKTPALILVGGISIWELIAAIKSSSGYYARNLYYYRQEVPISTKGVQPYLKIVSSLILK
jgi:hypothetical protein